MGAAGVMRLSVEAEPATLHWLGRAGSTGPEAAGPGAGGRSAAVEATQDRHYGGTRSCGSYAMLWMLWTRDAEIPPLLSLARRWKGRVCRNRSRGPRAGGQRRKRSPGLPPSTRVAQARAAAH